MFSLFHQIHDEQDSTARSRSLGQDILQVESVPRELELAWLAKITVSVCAVVLFLSTSSLVSLIPESRDSEPSALLFVVLVSSVVLVILGKFVSASLRDRAVLKTGKCCLGTIISQKMMGGGRHKRSRIFYEFPVGGHRPMTGQGWDLTKSYNVKMRVVVFYDPNDISRNVAICCTFWRVRSRAGYTLEP